MKRKIIFTFVAIAIAVTILHFYLLDGLDGLFFSSGFPEDTVYAAGYSDTAFRKLRTGMSGEEVLKLLSEPLRQDWRYEPSGEWLSFDNGKVQLLHAETSPLTQIRTGMLTSDVIKMVPEPSEESWVYSKSPGDNSYRVRVIILRDNRVTRLIHKFYVD